MKEPGLSCLEQITTDINDSIITQKIYHEIYDENSDFYSRIKNK